MKFSLPVAALALSAASQASASTPDFGGIVQGIVNGNIAGTESFLQVILALGTEGSQILSGLCSESDKTVFAPTNTALPDSSAFASIDTKALANFVRGHTLEMSKELADLADAEATGLNVAFVNGTQIRDVLNPSEVEITDGKLFLLAPNTTTLLEVTADTLLSAIQLQSVLGDAIEGGANVASSVVDALTTASGLTVLLPNRTAFEDLFKAYPDLLLEPFDSGTGLNTLSAVLLKHVTGDAITPGADNSFTDAGSGTTEVQAADFSGEIFPIAPGGGNSIIGINKVLLPALTEDDLKKFGGVKSMAGVAAGLGLNVGTISGLLDNEEIFGNGKTVLRNIIDAFLSPGTNQAGRIVFAPTDEAFDALGADTVKALTTYPHNFQLMQAVLRNHAAFQAVPAGDTLGLDADADVTTLQQNVYTVTANNTIVDAMSANVANVSGLVYGDDTLSLLGDSDLVIAVNQVLVPSLQEFQAAQLENAVSVVVESPDHTVLEQAVISAGLLPALQGFGDMAYLLFAPNDAAFTQYATDAGLIDSGDLTPEALASLMDNDADFKEAITQLLLAHVVADVGDLLSLAGAASPLTNCGFPDMREATFETLAGSSYDVAFNSVSFTISNVAGGDFTISSLSALAVRLNGAVVPVDRVLVIETPPPTPAPSAPIDNSTTPTTDPIDNSTTPTTPSMTPTTPSTTPSTPSTTPTTPSTTPTTPSAVPTDDGAAATAGAAHAVMAVLTLAAMLY